MNTELNRDARGKIINQARHQRQAAFERAALIAALGFKAEQPIASDRYAATTGELACYLIEDNAAHVVEHIRTASQAVR